jgi:hypothetical protein
MGKLKKQLEQKQLQMYDMMLQQIQKQNAPDPNLERLKSGYNKTLDWYDPSAHKDIYQHPTLAAEISPLQQAMADRDSKRVGTGFLGTSSTASNGYAKDMALDRSFKRRMAGAEMIENALRGEKDKAEAGLAGMAGADLSRINSTSSLMGQYNDALSGKIKQLSEGGFWKGVLGGVLGGMKGTIGKFTI